MTELLTAEEIAILSRLENDLITAYRDASVTPENRADAEMLRRSIRDRFKPYEIQSVLVGGIIRKALITLEAQQAQIKGLVGALEGILSDYEATIEAIKAAGGVKISIGQFRRLRTARHILSKVGEGK